MHFRENGNSATLYRTGEKGKITDRSYDVITESCKKYKYEKTSLHDSCSFLYK